MIEIRRCEEMLKKLQHCEEILKKMQHCEEKWRELFYSEDNQNPSTLKVVCETIARNPKGVMISVVLGCIPWLAYLVFPYFSELAVLSILMFGVSMVLSRHVLCSRDKHYHLYWYNKILEQQEEWKEVFKEIKKNKKTDPSINVSYDALAEADKAIKVLVNEMTSKQDELCKDIQYRMDKKALRVIVPVIAIVSAAIASAVIIAGKNAGENIGNPRMGRND